MMASTSREGSGGEDDPAQNSGVERALGQNHAAHYPDMTVSPQSCQFCRRRKIKCDKTLPVCNQCVKLRQTCIYQPSQRRGRPRNSCSAVATQDQSKETLLRKIRKLEAVVDRLKSTDGPHEDTADGLTDPLGKLVIGKPYLDDEFWSSKELTEVIGDSEESESEDGYVPASSAVATDFLWGANPVVQDLSSFHPPRNQILQYWQLYLDNCECLLRIIHSPTTQDIVNTFVASGPRCIDQDDELLLFCFYFAAVTSLSNEEALQHFGQQRQSLLNWHEIAVKHALTRAQFLHTQNFKVLQALVLYLICIRQGDATVSSVVWTMTGLALRIAQGMGIDRDGELFELSPFDTEMRRRLWYQILFLDLRGAETRGCLSAFLRYDTRLPTSINECDLSTTMTEYAKPALGLTDMTIPLMRFEVARLGRRLQATGFRDTPLPHLAKKKVIEEFQQQLFTKYVQHCLGAGPLQEYCSKTASMITARTNLVVYQGKMRGASQDEKDWLFNTCIEIMEYYEVLSKSETARRWSWLLKIHTQWHAIAFALAELCERRPSPQTERAWKIVDATCGEWQPPTDVSGTAIYNSVKKLLSKAQRRRYIYSAENLTSPEFGDSPNSISSGYTSDIPMAANMIPGTWNYKVAANTVYQDTTQPFVDGVIGSGEGPGAASTFVQSSIAGMPLQAGMHGASNLPDWFFGAANMRGQAMMNYAVDDTAWDWSDRSPHHLQEQANISISSSNVDMAQHGGGGQWTMPTENAMPWNHTYDTPFPRHMGR